MINTVIFDMDGLMVNTEIISYKLYKRLLERYNYEFTLDEYTRDFSGHTLVASITYIKNRFNTGYDIEETMKEFQQWEVDYIKENGVELKPGLVELLDYLKENNYKMVMATSSKGDRVKAIFDDYILEYFDAFAFGSEVEHGKPAPDIFLKACEKANTKLDDALVLEDSEAGIEAASKAGIKVICIPDLKKPSQEFADKALVLDALEQVIDYLENQW